MVDILIDMDGVLADFELGFYSKWIDRYPHLPAIHPSLRTEAYVTKEYTREPYNVDRRLIRDLMNEDHFALDFQPIEGAIEAVDQIVSSGRYTLAICTTPLTYSRTNAADKIHWIRKYLGESFVKKIIITTDKTIIAGKYLIDDYQWVYGSMSQIWKQLLMDAPYNRNIERNKLFTWQTWSEWLS